MSGLQLLHLKPDIGLYKNKINYYKPLPTLCKDIGR